MQPSVMGLVVCGVLLLIGRSLGNAYLVGLLISIPFCATAIGAVAGGATPLIYTFFTILLAVAVIRKKTFYHDIATVFRNDTPAWVALALIVYVVAGAYIFPRWFQGEAMVFQVSPTRDGVTLQPLGPVSFNFTQTAYFVLSVLAYIVVRMALVQKLNYDVLLRGLFAASITAALLGLIDLGGKLAGLGDVLSPIRTAGYAMLTGEDTMVGGFYRIAGGASEASAYAGNTLVYLAFAGSYWRATGSVWALMLTLVLFVLLLMSTSTTAIVGCGLIGAFVGLCLLIRALQNRLSRADLVLVGLGWTGLTLALLVTMLNPSIFDAIWSLVVDSVFHKAQTSSALERGDWNAKSFEAFLATGGLGIGAGSSRTSSWFVAILSQLGVVGAVLVGAVLFVVARGLHGRDTSKLDPKAVLLARTTSMAGLGSLVGSLGSGSTPDPGVMLFIALAIVCAVRAETHPEMSERMARYVPRLQ